jgi:four helix bundle protein
MRDEEIGGFMAEDLRERTKKYALRIIKLYTKLPQSEVARVMGRQILRAGTSVGANYREAYRARSDAEYMAKVGLCLQELEETGYWLELFAEAEIVPSNKLTALQDETNQLIAIFTSIVLKLKRKQSK